MGCFLQRKSTKDSPTSDIIEQNKWIRSHSSRRGKRGWCLFLKIFLKHFSFLFQPRCTKGHICTEKTHEALQKISSGYKGGYVCDSCGQNNGFPVFNCGECQFDICPVCSQNWVSNFKTFVVFLTRNLICFVFFSQNSRDNLYLLLERFNRK